MPAEQFAGTYQAQVWPENWAAWCLFETMATQWRAGPGGVIGLDYAVLAEELRLAQIPQAEHGRLRNDIRVLEAAALDCIYEES